MRHNPVVLETNSYIVQWLKNPVEILETRHLEITSGIGSADLKKLRRILKLCRYFNSVTGRPDKRKKNMPLKRMTKIVKII